MQLSDGMNTRLAFFGKIYYNSIKQPCAASFCRKEDLLCYTRIRWKLQAKIFAPSHPRYRVP